MDTDTKGASGADAGESANADPVDDANQIADKILADEKKATAKAEADAERQRLLDEAPALTIADILGVDDLTTEWVLVPEWKGKVLVRSLSGTERDAFEASIVSMKGKARVVDTANIRAKLCQLAIVEPTSKTLASMFTKKQIDALGKKSAAALDRVYEACSRLSGLGKADLDELAGNSEAGSADS